jgi:hypothetical protein
MAPVQRPGRASALRAKPGTVVRSDTEQPRARLGRRLAESAPGALDVGSQGEGMEWFMIERQFSSAKGYSTYLAAAAARS